MPRAGAFPTAGGRSRARKKTQPVAGLRQIHIEVEEDRRLQLLRKASYLDAESAHERLKARNSVVGQVKEQIDRFKGLIFSSR